MSEIEKKIYATKTMTIRSQYDNNQIGTLHTVQTADYSRIGYIAFDVDASKIPVDNVILHLYCSQSSTTDSPCTGLAPINSSWTLDTPKSQLPAYTRPYETIKLNEGWSEIEVSKTQLVNGWCLYPTTNIYSATFAGHLDTEGYEPYISYMARKPDISDLEVNGTLENVTCTWKQVDCTGWKVEVFLNNALQVAKTGTTLTSCSFVNELFETGDYTFKLTCYHDQEETVEETSIKLTQIITTITSLEPDTINKLRDKQIQITFSGTNISYWSLNVSQNGVLKHMDNGTTSRSSTIQANVLSNGPATITLIAAYQGIGYTTSVTRVATFTAYGKPGKPEFDIQETYNTPKPLFAWTSKEQVAWKFAIETSTGQEVANTGERYGQDNSYQPTISLSNNTYYVAKLQIKNQYDLWSDVASHTFKVEFATLSAPQFTLYSDHENAKNVLVIESPIDENFVKHVVYRRERGKVWQQIADNVARVQTVEDCECKANVEYEYKVSAVSTLEAFTDSKINQITCNFHNTHISIANTSDKVILNMEVESNVQYVDDITFTQYDGQDKPDSSSSGMSYATLNVDAEVDTDTYNSLMRYWKEPLLCLRDRSGLLLYGRITRPSTNFKCYGVYNITFGFTECHNEEVDMNACDEYRYCYFIERQW